MHEPIPFDNYPTPPDLARFIIGRAVAIAGVRPSMAVLEPGCGDGAPFLAAAALYQEARLVGVELRAVELPPPLTPAADGRVHLHSEVDYLRWRAPILAPGEFDVIATNPPFKQALAFIQHSLALLAPHGVAAFLCLAALLAGNERFEILYSAPERRPLEVWNIVRRPSFVHGSSDRAQEYVALFFPGAALRSTLAVLGRDETRMHWHDNRLPPRGGRRPVAAPGRVIIEKEGRDGTT